MSEAAKRSLKRRELHLPPWRKNRFMQSKWFGPYRRTVYEIPAKASLTPGMEKFAVKCRRAMAVFVRAKRVTDPLDEKVKACICGRDHRKTSYVSSGSEHEGDDSPCLSDLVQGFLEDDAGVRPPEDASDSEPDQSLFESTDMIEHLLIDNGDPFHLLLLSHVSKAVEIFSCLRSNKAIFRRNVMLHLRDSGHNAAICKTKWETSGGLAAGSYEFIDVVRSDDETKHQRYFVDLDFAEEFEIARATPQYERLFLTLPKIFVGRSEELKQIVRLMSEAAKRSLKRRELHLPPWRKNRFMQSKWFGPYRRTVNQIPGKESLSPIAVQCRYVGFDAVSDGNGRFFTPAATRSR
ncbi:hypothetical protein HHK36_013127 [Tetracentron sinense]|uniref:DUF506 family protein n=1 Tax=Tetracentron sinense TaxID=13715 RepID=A0A834ZAK3_TETSI|nr:hypothetical protein HHK36_013127 [Tetracentron sinense]